MTEVHQPGVTEEIAIAPPEVPNNLEQPASPEAPEWYTENRAKLVSLNKKVDSESLTDDEVALIDDAATHLSEVRSYVASLHPTDHQGRIDKRRAQSFLRAANRLVTYRQAPDRWLWRWNFNTMVDKDRATASPEAQQMRLDRFEKVLRDYAVLDDTEEAKAEWQNFLASKEKTNLVSSASIADSVQALRATLKNYFNFDVQSFVVDNNDETAIIIDFFDRPGEKGETHAAIPSSENVDGQEDVIEFHADDEEMFDKAGAESPELDANTITVEIIRIVTNYLRNAGFTEFVSLSDPVYDILLKEVEKILGGTFTSDLLGNASGLVPMRLCLNKIIRKTMVLNYPQAADNQQEINKQLSAFDNQSWDEIAQLVRAALLEKNNKPQLPVVAASKLTGQTIPEAETTAAESAAFTEVKGKLLALLGEKLTPEELRRFENTGAAQYLYSLIEALLAEPQDQTTTDKVIDVCMGEIFSGCSLAVLQDEARAQAIFRELSFSLAEVLQGIPFKNNEEQESGSPEYSELQRKVLDILSRNLTDSEIKQFKEGVLGQLFFDTIESILKEPLTESETEEAIDHLMNAFWAAVVLALKSDTDRTEEIKSFYDTTDAAIEGMLREIPFLADEELSPEALELQAKLADILKEYLTDDEIENFRASKGGRTFFRAIRSMLAEPRTRELTNGTINFIMREFWKEIYDSLGNDGERRTEFDKVSSNLDYALAKLLHEIPHLPEAETDEAETDEEAAAADEEGSAETSPEFEELKHKLLELLATSLTATELEQFKNSGTLDVLKLELQELSSKVKDKAILDESVDFCMNEIWNGIDLALNGDAARSGVVHQAEAFLKLDAALQKVLRENPAYQIAQPTGVPANTPSVVILDESAESNEIMGAAAVLAQNVVLHAQEVIFPVGSNYTFDPEPLDKKSELRAVAKEIAKYLQRKPGANVEELLGNIRGELDDLFQSVTIKKADLVLTRKEKDAQLLEELSSESFDLALRQILEGQAATVEGTQEHDAAVATLHLQREAEKAANLSPAKKLANKLRGLWLGVTSRFKKDESQPEVITTPSAEKKKIFEQLKEKLRKNKGKLNSLALAALVLASSLSLRSCEPDNQSNTGTKSGRPDVAAIQTGDEESSAVSDNENSLPTPVILPAPISKITEMRVSEPGSADIAPGAPGFVFRSTEITVQDTADAVAAVEAVSRSVPNVDADMAFMPFAATGSGETEETNVAGQTQNEVAPILTVKPDGRYDLNIGGKVFTFSVKDVENAIELGQQLVDSALKQVGEVLPKAPAASAEATAASEVVAAPTVSAASGDEGLPSGQVTPESSASSELLPASYERALAGWFEEFNEKITSISQAIESLALELQSEGNIDKDISTERWNAGIDIAKDYFKGILNYIFGDASTYEQAEKNFPSKKIAKNIVRAFADLQKQIGDRLYQSSEKEEYEKFRATLSPAAQIALDLVHANISELTSEKLTKDQIRTLDLYLANWAVSHDLSFGDVGLVLQTAATSETAPPEIPQSPEPTASSASVQTEIERPAQEGPQREADATVEVQPKEPAKTKGDQILRREEAKYPSVWDVVVGYPEIYGGNYLKVYKAFEKFAEWAMSNKFDWGMETDEGRLQMARSLNTIFDEVNRLKQSEGAVLTPGEKFVDELHNGTLVFEDPQNGELLNALAERVKKGVIETQADADAFLGELDSLVWDVSAEKSSDTAAVAGAGVQAFMPDIRSAKAATESPAAKSTANTEKVEKTPEQMARIAVENAAIVNPTETGRALTYYVGLSPERRAKCGLVDQTSWDRLALRLDYLRSNLGNLDGASGARIVFDLITTSQTPIDTVTDADSLKENNPLREFAMFFTEGKGAPVSIRSTQEVNDFFASVNREMAFNHPDWLKAYLAYTAEKFPETLRDFIKNDLLNPANTNSAEVAVWLDIKEDQLANWQKTLVDGSNEAMRLNIRNILKGKTYNELVNNLLKLR